MLVSIIITNFNYAKFVETAIESALALQWDDIEVIVVDDGSTDHSPDLIDAFVPKITVLRQEHAGQRIAYNTGFKASRGELIVFLDADDTLEPSIISDVFPFVREGVSKIQVQMNVIDTFGVSVGSRFPQYKIIPTPVSIRTWYLTSGSYPTPPGSGNLYTREYLAKIFPLDDSCGEAGDSSCIAGAPLLGDVHSVLKPLVNYRVHGANDGAFSELVIDRFAREVTRALKCFDYSRRIASGAGLTFAPQAIMKSMMLLPYRISSFRLAPQMHPIRNDSRRRILADAWAGFSTPQGLTNFSSFIIMLWAILALSLPLSAAKRLILWRFSIVSRPRSITRLLQLVGILSKPSVT
jgi:glycosyltransferase involved in cell wall biosynthesis